MNLIRAQSLAAVWTHILLPIIATVAISAPAAAQGRPGADRDHDRNRKDRHEVVIVRPGHVVRALPNSPARIRVGPRDFFYHGGVFYEPRGRDYIVVAAPIGARVRALPPGFVRFGIGGRNYFYFNATFYIWDEPTKEYIVVEKPEGSTEALQSAQPAAASGANMFVYPARGQSQEQTRQDRYECHVWATDETSFDPSRGDSDAAASSEYQRAMQACLEGRGYSVR